MVDSYACIEKDLYDLKKDYKEIYDRAHVKDVRVQNEKEKKKIDCNNPIVWNGFVRRCRDRLHQPNPSLGCSCMKDSDIVRYAKGGWSRDVFDRTASEHQRKGANLNLPYHIHDYYGTTTFLACANPYTHTVYSMNLECAVALIRLNVDPVINYKPTTEIFRGVFDRFNALVQRWIKVEDKEFGKVC